MKFVTPSIAKGRLWLKYFGHSNSLHTKALRAIVNYTPIGEYWLRFFPYGEKNFSSAHAILILLNQDNIFVMNLKSFRV